MTETQAKFLPPAWENQARVAELEDHLLALTERFESALEEQGSLIETLSAEQAQISGIRLRVLNERLTEAGSRLEVQSTQLSTLDQRLSQQENATADLRQQLAGLFTEVAEDRESNRKRTWIAAGIATLTLVILGAASTYLHLNPVAESQTVNEQISVIGAEQSRLENALSALTSGLGSLGTQVNTQSEQLDLQSQQTASLSEGQMLQDQQIEGLGRSLSELRVLVSGPGQIDPTQVTPVLPLNDASWISAQPSDHMTLQIGGFYRESDLARFINQHQTTLDGMPLSYSSGQLAGNPWFNLYAGSYASVTEGLNALDTLPLTIQRNSPYLRTFASIR